jgi:hypothetical protein
MSNKEAEAPPQAATCKQAQTAEGRALTLPGVRAWVTGSAKFDTQPTFGRPLLVPGDSRNHEHDWRAV